MPARTAKLFTTGRSQAVRLPIEFRFEGKEVFIRRDPRTGDVILSRKPEPWAGGFELYSNESVPDDFMGRTIAGSRRRTVIPSMARLSERLSARHQHRESCHQRRPAGNHSPPCDVAAIPISVFR